jgi:hypothetical protein
MATTTNSLTNENLVNLLREELERFSEDYYPLHQKQLKAIQRCTDLVGEEESKLVRNTPKRRAHIILKDLWTHIPEVFLLCSLAITPTRLGCLKSINYMEFISRWWRDIGVVPEGLSKAFDRHSDILPKVARDSREVLIPISLDELFGFLRQHFGGERRQMSFAFSGSPLPFVRIERQSKLELSWDLANAFVEQHREKLQNLPLSNTETSHRN